MDARAAESKAALEIAAVDEPLMDPGFLYENPGYWSAGAQAVLYENPGYWSAGAQAVLAAYFASEHGFHHPC